MKLLRTTLIVVVGLVVLAAIAVATLVGIGNAKRDRRVERRR